MAAANICVPGSIYAVREFLKTGICLVLAVDQEAGKRWLARDPCLEHDPFEGGVQPEEQFILTRYLGLRLAEVPFLSKSDVPREDPRQDTVVRWKWAQFNQMTRVAGPDVESIERFVARTRESLWFGMTGADFLLDVNIQLLYLRGRKPDQTLNRYERAYLAMLEELVPFAAIEAAA